MKKTLMRKQRFTVARANAVDGKGNGTGEISAKQQLHANTEWIRGIEPCANMRTHAHNIWHEPRR